MVCRPGAHMRALSEKKPRSKRTSGPTQFEKLPEVLKRGAPTFNRLSLLNPLGLRERKITDHIPNPLPGKFDAQRAVLRFLSLPLILPSHQQPGTSSFSSVPSSRQIWVPLVQARRSLWRSSSSESWTFQRLQHRFAALLFKGLVE